MKLTSLTGSPVTLMTRQDLANTERVFAGLSIGDSGRRKNKLAAEAIDGSVRSQDRLSNIQDLTWALLNAKEFVFRH